MVQKEPLLDWSGSEFSKTYFNEPPWYSLLHRGITPMAIEERLLNNLTTTMHNLYPIMRYKFPDFPNNYCVFDIETTGVDVKKDLIVQIGICLVMDRKIEFHSHEILDWTRVKSIDQKWLRTQLIQCKVFVDAKKGYDAYKMNYDRLQKEGSDPIVVLNEYLKTFLHCEKEGLFFVVHNGYRFDCKFLEHHFQEHLNQYFDFDPESIFDTGVIAKGIQVGEQAWPCDMSIVHFVERVARAPIRKVHWSLDKFCIPFFELNTKYNLDSKNAHDAHFDVYATHLLFQEFCRIASERKPSYVEIPSNLRSSNV